mgnify:CR=1 FL=1
MNIKNGLTDEQVKKSRNEFGSNNITAKKQNSFWKLLMESLGDPIIRILIIALGIKLIFLLKDFDWYETVGIVIAIFLASFISSISEYGSEKAFAKLQEDASKIKCRVRRNGKLEEVNIDDVVVGDIILLQPGDKVPADGIILEGELLVDESSLNGETKEVKKESITKISVVSEKNTVFRGTVIYSKEATVQITKVGDNTFYGSIAKELQEKTQDSPLKIRLRGLANVISKIGYIGAALVSISYLFSVIVIKNHFDFNLIKETITNIPLITGHILHALTLSVTIIVVAVPEGLPMMITLVLSSNMKRMLKNNVMVRKMVGIETAGSLNILFTDKTGTLTKGKMEMIKFLGNDFKSYKNEKELKVNPKYYEIIKKSIIYNTSSIYSEDKKEIMGGNVTDRAILGFIKSEDNYKLKKIETVPFDSKNKYSKVTVIDKNPITLIKGAPEKILALCTKYYNNQGEEKLLLGKTNINYRLSKETSKGFRVIAFATSKTSDMKNLTLVGFALIKDDIRKEAIEGLKLINRAKIQTVMITGDNKDTAVSIGKEVGILNSPEDVVLTSDELKTMSDEKIKTLLPNLRVVSRSLPQDKSRLVRISQEMGLVVGMTGDGVNDAPALKSANIGIAMGSGTDIARETADMIIVDDNFKSIVAGIKEGRVAYANIRKIILFLISCGLTEVLFFCLAIIFDMPMPLVAIQLLWINVVTDGIQDLALSFEKAEKNIMKENPISPKTPLFDKTLFKSILFSGIFNGLLVFIVWYYLINILGMEVSLARGYTMALMVFIQNIHVFNCRSEKQSAFSIPIKSNILILIAFASSIILQILVMEIPILSTFLQTKSIPFLHLVYLFLLASTSLYAVETYKNIKYNVATIGDLRPTRGLRFKGKMYDIAVYNRVLSKDEVMHNWNYANNKWNIDK